MHFLLWFERMVRIFFPRFHFHRWVEQTPAEVAARRTYRMRIGAEHYRICTECTALQSHLWTEWVYESQESPSQYMIPCNVMVGIEHMIRWFSPRFHLHRWKLNRLMTIMDIWPIDEGQLIKSCACCEKHERWLPGYGGSEIGCWLPANQPPVT